MNEGWIKIFYKLQAWEWYGDPNMVATWIHLLLSANWKDKKWRGISIKRGQLITSRTNLAEGIGLTERQLRTCLEHLQESGEIACETTNRYTIITICKYESYQGNTEDNRPAERPTERPTNDQQTTSRRPAEGQQTTTPIELQEYNIINKDSRKKEGESDAPAPEGFEDFENYGILHNVKLKPAHVRHLRETYGTEVADETIDDLSCKLADGSVNSHDHYATLLTWLRYRRRTDTGTVPMSSAQLTEPEPTGPAKSNLNELDMAVYDEFMARKDDGTNHYQLLRELKAKYGHVSDDVCRALGMIYYNKGWNFK